MVGGNTRPGQDCYFYVYSRSIFTIHYTWTSHWTEGNKIHFLLQLFEGRHLSISSRTSSSHQWNCKCKVLECKRWEEQSSKKCLASWGDHDHERRARDKEREKGERMGRKVKKVDGRGGMREWEGRGGKKGREAKANKSLHLSLNSPNWKYSRCVHTGWPGSATRLTASSGTLRTRGAGGYQAKKLTCHDDNVIFFCRKRNVTKCYWETQPQGCAKPHCPFLHQYPKVNIFQNRLYSSLNKTWTNRIQSRRRFPLDTMLLVLRPQTVRWANLPPCCS